MNATLVSRALHPANAYNVGAHVREVYRTESGFVAYAILFLYPLIASENNQLLVQVLAFFVPYFFFLGFDTFFTIRLISKK